MGKEYILYRDGRMFYDRLSNHGLTNELMHKCKRPVIVFNSTIDILHKYGLKATIFNTYNLQTYGKITIPRSIAEKIIVEHMIDVIRR